MRNISIQQILNRHEQYTCGNAHIPNVPIFRASTVIFNSVEDFIRAGKLGHDDPYIFRYGRYGTPTTFTLSKVLEELYNANSCYLFPSGMAAVANGILSTVCPGDNILYLSNIFSPTKSLLKFLEEKYSISSTEIPFNDLHNINNYITQKSKALYFECPASYTYEVVDIDQIVTKAKTLNLKTIIDDTYGCGMLFNPIDHGVDLVVLSGTKYYSGNSDVMFGVVISRTKETSSNLKTQSWSFGQRISPDDAGLVLKSLKTLDLRLDRHHKNSIELRNALFTNKKVTKIYHPSIEGSYGYEYFQNNIKSSNGLITIGLGSCTIQEHADFMNNLKLIGIGASWGGHESLAMPISRKSLDGEIEHLVRIHVGLEPVDHIIQDIFSAIN